MAPINVQSGVSTAQGLPTRTISFFCTRPCLLYVFELFGEGLNLSSFANSRLGMGYFLCLSSHPNKAHDLGKGTVPLLTLVTERFVRTLHCAKRLANRFTRLCRIVSFSIYGSVLYLENVMNCETKYSSHLTRGVFFN